MFEVAAISEKMSFIYRCKAVLYSTRPLLSKFSCFGAAFVFLFFSPVSYAENTCEFQKEIGGKRERVFVLEGRRKFEEKEVVLSCTDKDNVVKVTLREKKTKRNLQIFYTKQYRFYLEATTPDIDGDGYRDLVLGVALGNPNIQFEAWRYDRNLKKLVLSLEQSGMDFFKSKSGDIILYSKVAGDVWKKVIYIWTGNKLHPKYEIDISLGDGTYSLCHYYQKNQRESNRITTPPSSIAQYCYVGIDDEIDVNFFEGMK